MNKTQSTERSIITYLKSTLLISLVVLSTFAFAAFAFPVQAEAPGISAAGSHEITVNYYEAYIYDDHDGWPRGAGDWYFQLYGGGAWTPLTPEYSRDGPGWADFPDRIRIWYISGSTSFTCWAGEMDEGWDYTSSYTLNLAFPGLSVNVWHSGSGLAGDVRHYYQYYIKNLAPTVGVISGSASGYRKVAYTFTTSGSDPEGDSITYQWRVDGVLQAATGSSLIYTFGTGAALGSHTITVATRDYFGAYSSTSSKTFWIYNRAPTVGVISGPSTGYPGISYMYSTTGSDPDGDPITYEWRVNGVLQLSTGPTMMHVFPAAGTYTLQVRTKDSLGLYSGYASKTVTITGASISIWADKNSYHIGETMKVYLRVKNPTPNPLPVKVLVILRLTDASTMTLLSMTTTLPANFDSGDVLWQSFKIPTVPLGNYAWIGELRNPTTNALISQSTFNWMVWP